MGAVVPIHLFPDEEAEVQGRGEAGECHTVS